MSFAASRCERRTLGSEKGELHMDSFVKKGRMFFLGCLCSTLLGFGTRAQEMPTDYQEVLKSLDRKGDFKAGVLNVNIPLTDLKITTQPVPTPPPFGFGA